ncbi:MULTISPECIES: super-infection exclusion protein B [Aliagarivorans]|uniref:super-infection exclusion protein B n=1 Tax=Aliagarivorans TaxID=882379 RepID=UPI0003FAF79A|nr:MULTISPECIES: super-infection exclusion protein B [Aliagarivorans]
METINRFVLRWGALDVVVAWLSIASAMLLFIPQNVLHIQKLEGQGYTLAVIGLIVGIAFFVSRGLMLAASFAKRSWFSRKQMQQLSSMIACLDHTERAVLREFVIARKSVLNLPVLEPSVVNLIDNGVLTPVKPRQMIEGRTRVDLMISLEARPLLSYRALGLPVGKLSEEHVEQLKAKRPPFLRADYQASRTHNGRLFRIRAEQTSANGEEQADGEHAA